jgi:7-keto-8-aminopelargonate synthetase-like enzyme
VHIESKATKASLLDMDEAKASPLQAQLHRLLDRRRQQSKLRCLKASPPGSIDFSSNDFLSLSTSPTLRAIFLDELTRHTSQLGSTGSRLLDGNSVYAENLEGDIAAFHNGPAGLLVNSGFDANVGIFSCLPQPGDIVVYDELIHASVHDGIKASRAGRSLPFAHNSVLDLKNVLKECVLKSSVGPSYNIFIAVESVYSMDGDLAPLTEIVEVMEALFPRKNAHLIVDEAHATGIYGDEGRGKVCELGLESKVFVRLHTFGKALACNGGKTFVSDSFNRETDGSSNYTLHSPRTTVSHQLRSTSDIHNVHVLSCTCSNQGSLHLHGKRQHSTTGQRFDFPHRNALLQSARIERQIWPFRFHRRSS